MAHVYAAVTRHDRERLLSALHDLKAMHLKPVTEGNNSLPDAGEHGIQRMERAMQIISGVKLSDEPAPALSGSDAIERVLDLQRRAAELRKQLDDLERAAKQAACWGEVDLAKLRDLEDSGVVIRIISVPRDAARGHGFNVIAEVPSPTRKHRYLAVVNPPDVLPEDFELQPVPEQNLRQIREEAAAVHRELEEIDEELRRLAHLRPRIREAIEEQRLVLEWRRARTGGFEDEAIFAVSGWMPEQTAGTLALELARRDLPGAAVYVTDGGDEEPPTMIDPPRWTQPIRGLFEMLGTVPGYREFDVSAPFMIALPLFAAVLIGDGGYGALIALVPLLLFRRMSARMGRDFTVLIVVMGVTSICWGLISSNFFGYRLYQPLIPVDLTEYSRNLMMQLSFVMGAMHLSLAQLWQAATFYPDGRFVGRIGWAAFIWGMYGVVQYFVLGGSLSWGTPWPYLLTSGAVLAILFARSDKNVLKAVALGFAEFPLSMISAFSDVISYVRLMAVGLATTVLAVAFNEMAAGLSPWPMAALLWTLGHGLNIGLVLIAIFAHGVRLNMLEFSTNLGMQWSGYPFRPFGAHSTHQLR